MTARCCVTTDATVTRANAYCGWGRVRAACSSEGVPGPEKSRCLHNPRPNPSWLVPLGLPRSTGYYRFPAYRYNKINIMSVRYASARHDDHAAVLLLLSWLLLLLFPAVPDPPPAPVMYLYNILYVTYAFVVSVGHGRRTHTYGFICIQDDSPSIGRYSPPRCPYCCITIL